MIRLLQTAALCVAALAGSVSQGSALPFTPSSTINGASLSVGTTSTSVGLPSGATVLVSNSGSQDAYITLGTTIAVMATTSGTYVKAGVTGMQITVGSNSYLAAITASGSTTLNISGGSTALTVTSGGPYVYTALGFQNVTVSTSAVGFTPPAGATICFIQTESHAVRYRTDGRAPTQTVGSLLPISNTAASYVLPLTASLSSVTFISADGSTATLDIDCDR
jgi:hypothetical protein